MNKPVKGLTFVAVFALFIVASIVSYGHGFEVAVAAGEARASAAVWPLLSDLTWPIATVILAIPTMDAAARWWARVAQVLSFSATAYANLAAAHLHGSTVHSYVVAGVVAVIMLVTGEMVVGLVRSLNRKTAPRRAPSKASGKAPVRAPRKRAAAQAAGA